MRHLQRNNVFIKARQTIPALPCRMRALRHVGSWQQTALSILKRFFHQQQLRPKIKRAKTFEAVETDPRLVTQRDLLCLLLGLPRARAAIYPRLVVRWSLLTQHLHSWDDPEPKNYI